MTNPQSLRHEGLYSSWDMSCGASHNGYGYTSPRNTVVEAAKTMEGSMVLQRFLDEGNHVLRQQIFKGILANLFEVMTNEFAHHLFRKLLEDCESRELQTIVFTLCSHDHLFVESEIRNLIKKLKRHYVVQHVLTLKEENISRAICIRLERHYMHLAQRMGGSHVVENCMKSSEFGMESVVRTLLQREKALLHLASDKFGNYVVQKALEVTKQDNKKLYESLVMVLITKKPSLSGNVIGRHVVNMIKRLEDNNV
ncbi:unnamed protein product [Cuscuta campestris]|uniref:PUM-HD domain-containing protein n=1 Tax=Cuscuta campestris TaxID=132261 RepID=A0A484K560_9ASTE|nr:unnamed protein product [Cuscuta campestris]